MPFCRTSSVRLFHVEMLSFYLFIFFTFSVFQQTDFVCFDTGHDKFPSYDVDVLLGDLKEVDEGSDETVEETGISHPGHDEGEAVHADDDLNDSETLYEGKDEDVYGNDFRTSPGADSDQELVVDTDVADEPSPKDDGGSEQSDHTTQTEAPSELKTTLGTTFDAVTSDDENTQKVTPNDDDDSDEDQSSNDVIEQTGNVEREHMKEPSLISFDQKPSYIQNSVPDATESGNKHDPFPNEVTAHGEDGAKDGEKTDENGVVNANPLRAESHHGNAEDDSKTSWLPPEMTYEIDSDIHVAIKSPNPDYDQELVVDKHIPDKSLSKDDGVLEQSDHTTQTEAPSELKTTLGWTFDAVTSDDENTHKVTPDDDDDDKDSDKDQSNNDVVEQPGDKEEVHVMPSLLSFDPKPSYTQDSVPDGTESGDKRDPFQNSVSEKAMKDDSVWSPGDFKTVNGDQMTDLSEDNSDDHDTREKKEQEEEKEEKKEEGEKKEEEKEEEEKGEDAETTGKDPDELQLQTSLDHDLETSETGDETKPSVHDSVMSPLITVPELNPDLIKDDKEIQIKSTELAGAVKSESEDTKQPIESLLGKNFGTLTPVPGEMESHAPEAPSSEGVHSAPELLQQPDEQTDRVKHQIIDLFERTLKAEKSQPEEKEDAEELLEDENAAFGAKPELADEADGVKESSSPEAQFNSEDRKISANESALEEHDGKPGVEISPDVSASTPDHENHVKSVPGDEFRKVSVLGEEPEYSDSVLRLTLLREHFEDDAITRFLRHLSIKDLYRIEAMFSEFDLQLKTAAQSYSRNSESLEHALDSIVEVSENAILDEIDGMLDARGQRELELGQQIDPLTMDEEATVLDDFQEFAFRLHQKYSPSVPLMKESQAHLETGKIYTLREVVERR